MRQRASHDMWDVRQRGEQRLQHFRFCAGANIRLHVNNTHAWHALQRPDHQPHAVHPQKQSMHGEVLQAGEALRQGRELARVWRGPPGARPADV